MPEFTNCLHNINKKGYIWHLVIYDEHFRSEIDKFIHSNDCEAVLEQLKKLDTKETSDKLKQATVTDFCTIGMKIDPKDVEDGGNEEMVEMGSATISLEGTSGGKNFSPYWRSIPIGYFVSSQSQNVSIGFRILTKAIWYCFLRRSL